MLDSFVHIRRMLSNTSITDSEIIGSLSFTIEDLEHLKTLSSRGCVDEFVTMEGSSVPIEDIEISDRPIEVRIYPQQLTEEFFFEDESALLNRFSQNHPNKKYYVHSLEYWSDQEDRPSFIVNYKSIISLIGLLKNIADYHKKIPPFSELVFFQSKKLILITEYKTEDVQLVEKIDSLKNQFTSAHDREERQSIFVNELINSLVEVKEKKNRFKHLIKHFSEIFEQYVKSHKFYLEQFSFQKIKTELDSEKIEYAKKLQGVINDAQTKLVAIPAAFLLIVSQFDLTGEKIYLNLALVLSAIVFSILLDILIRNQYSALNFISEDINRFKCEFQEKKAVLPTKDFDETFDKISSLQRKQKCYLNIIRGLVWLTPVFAILLFSLALIDNSVISVIRDFIDYFD